MPFYDYELIRKMNILGKGGFGTVYKAELKQEIVALKIYDKINPDSKIELQETYKQLFSEVSINLSIPNPMVN